MQNIHPTAVISTEANIHAEANIGPYVVVDGPVTVGKGTTILAQVHLTGHTTIGQDCVIHPFAAIGGPPQDYGFKGERSFCRIGDRNIIREGVTIHCASGEGLETIVGNDCMLMAQSHIGHNCKVGNNVILTNCALLAGHVSVGDRAILGGSAAVHQFARIGEFAMIAGKSQLRQDAVPFMSHEGNNYCFGVNRIGLRRNGFSQEEINELRDCHRRLFTSGLIIRKAAQQMIDEVKTAPAKRLIEFILADSKRGIGVRQKHSNSD